MPTMVPVPLGVLTRLVIRSLLYGTVVVVTASSKVDVLLIESSALPLS